MKLLHKQTLSQETLLTLASKIPFKAGKTASRTLAQNESIRVTLFALDRHQIIPFHPSNSDRFITVLENSATVTTADRLQVVTTGETLVIPAKLPHCAYAAASFKMLLTEIFYRAGEQNEGKN